LVAPSSTKRQAPLKVSILSAIPNEDKPLTVKHHITKKSAAPITLADIAGGSSLKQSLLTKDIKTDPSTFIERSSRNQVQTNSSMRR